MACSKILDLSVAQTGDTGMDNAIFESTTGKIFGVRGEWLFKFNATTGALEQSMQYTHNALSPSYITAFGGNLYISCYAMPILNTNGVAPYTNGGDVYVVNAAAFTLTGPLSMSAGINPGFATNYGFASMANNGTLIAVLEKQLSRWNGDNSLLLVDPTNIPAYATMWGGLVSDVCYDSTNSVFWGVESLAAQIFVSDGVSSANNTTGLAPVFGVCFNTATNKVFAAAGDEQFYEVSAAAAVPGFTNFAVTTRHTGRINANPFRIKSVNGLASNPLNGKVLIPCWKDDSVVVWNPGTNAVDSTKTGFTAPIDVVSTTTKNWAVQTGTTGLKEIT